MGKIDSHKTVEFLYHEIGSTSKYYKRYDNWETYRGNISFFYLTLVLVLIELLFSNIITYYLGGLCLLMCIYLVPAYLWAKAGHVKFIEEVNEKIEKEEQQKKQETRKA